MLLTKSENRNTLASPKGLKSWLLAARPKTWIASISPVAMGTALAAQSGAIDPFLFSLTLLFALCIQIGTNYSNDYFDFIKGSDTKERIGPLRAVQQGWISPPRMLTGALFTFCLAFLFALPLMIRAGWWSYPIALASILFGLLYTGGPKPIGYLGLSEIFVLSFFGPIAVCGAYFLQTLSPSLPSLMAGIGAGFFSCALLVANNLRDEDSDRKAGKKTLVVRWGRNFGLCEYFACLIVPFVLPFALVLFFQANFGLCLTGIPFLLLAKPIYRGLAEKQKTVSLLPLTSLLFLLYTLLFCLYACRPLPI